MRVHPFEVARTQDSIDLDAVLKLIENDPLGERVRSVGHYDVRAETVSFERKLWFIDFVKFRFDHAPGKAHRERPIEGIAFGKDEGVAEETAMLFDPALKVALIQYNHYGVRSAAIADYLSGYSRSPSDGFTFKPKYDLEAERRLMSKRIFRRMQFSISPTKMRAGDRIAGQSVTAALDLGRKAGAGVVTVSLSVGSGNRGGLNFSAVMDSVRQLRRLAGDNVEAVSRLEVAGKQDPDDVVEVLDLLEPRLMLDVGTDHPGDDLRVPRGARWGALEMAHQHWKKKRLYGES